MLFIGRSAGLLFILLCWLLLFLSLFFYINAARFGVSIKQPAPAMRDEHERPNAALFIAVLLLLFGIFFINDFLLFIGLLLV